MRYAFLALGVAAAAGLSAAPAYAHHHHHRFVAAYNVGYSFGPDYAYTDVDALPGPIVTRYHLRGDRFRFVNRNGFVYVVNPNTYRVVRVIRVG